MENWAFLIWESSPTLNGDLTIFEWGDIWRDIRKNDIFGLEIISDLNEEFALI